MIVMLQLAMMAVLLGFSRTVVAVEKLPFLAIHMRLESICVSGMVKKRGKACLAVGSFKFQFGQRTTSSNFRIGINKEIYIIQRATPRAFFSFKF